MIGYKKLRLFILSLSLLSGPLSSEETVSDQAFEAIGHLIGKELMGKLSPLNFEALAKGLQEEAKGTPSPLSEEACLEALSLLQEIKQKEKSAQNLQEATYFFQRLGKTISEKWHYEIMTPGKENALCSYHRPLVRYQKGFLHQNLSSPIEERLDLDEIFPAMKQALLGMREKEKRRIYLHPDLAPQEASASHPNALTIFEVELLELAPSTEEKRQEQR